MHPAQGQRDIAQGAEMRVEIEGLKHHSDPLPHPVQIDIRARQSVTFNEYLSGIGLFEPVTTAQHGGFP